MGNLTEINQLRIFLKLINRFKSLFWLTVVNGFNCSEPFRTLSGRSPPLNTPSLPPLCAARTRPCVSAARRAPPSPLPASPPVLSSWPWALSSPSPEPLHSCPTARSASSSPRPLCRRDRGRGWPRPMPLLPSGHLGVGVQPPLLEKKKKYFFLIIFL